MSALKPLPPLRETRDPQVVIDAFIRLRGLNRTELLEGFGKTRSISQPRHELMWLLRELTNLSQTEIGRWMGGRDMATVHAGIRNTAERAGASPEYRGQLAQMRAYVLAYAPGEAGPGEDAATVLARRLLIERDRYDADVAGVATVLVAVAAVLRSPDLTDAEARLAAASIIRTGGRASHG